MGRISGFTSTMSAMPVSKYGPNVYCMVISQQNAQPLLSSRSSKVRTGLVVLVNLGESTDLLGYPVTSKIVKRRAVTIQPTR